ncbi:MAG: hypothetical protein H6R13_356 [Proteobacteria bacterium]|nr:hypothetical protein [Pseudomonadota bacterium]
MRNNGAISGKEIEIRDDQLIISRTDNQGHIVYVNADFVEISGFSEEELIGQPHNMVRHPDMPSEVFADLWRDLKAGRPWIGLIKNRNKNGDAYWVEAHVSPIWDKDKISGYMSMRRKASRTDILLAEQNYAAMQKRTDSSLVFEHGSASQHKRWGSLRNAFSNAPLAIKFIVASLAAAALVLGLTAYFLASHVSRTLDENARHQLTHDVSLLRAAVSARVEGANIEAVEYSKVLSKRVYDAIGGQRKASREALEAMIVKMSDSPGNPIDVFLHDLRGVGTIFILTPEGFQRRMTTAVDDNGASPVGSYLATDHPAFLLLTAGQTFVGPARVFGRQYVTRYTPILDAQGGVVGATVIGIDVGEQLDTLKRQMRSMQVGETGYYYIVDSTPGPNFGSLILHPYKEGQNLANFRMENGQGLIDEMAKIGTGAISYSWKNEEAGETAARKKLVIFETLDDPKWIVAGGTSVDEFTALSDRIVWLVIAGGLAMATAIFVIIQILVRKLILNPLNSQVLPTFHAISAGKFDTQLDVRGNDEMAQVIQGLESLRNRLAFNNERERTLSAMRELARQEAEALARARAEFLANMSHEIRTPLNAVIGLAYLLLQNKLGEREMEYAKRIEGAGKLLLAIVNDVLDFSKIDAGRMQLEEASFRLDDLLDNLSSLVRNRVHEKNLVLEYVVAPDTPQNLRGDALRLSQILINLVSNAIKFTAEGSITVFVNAAPPEDGRAELEFRISDTGIGMSAEQLENLFRAFSQADSSVTRKFGGTGLGLVISKRLIEMMGGSIQVESTPKAGSTFSFRVCLGIDDAPAETVRKTSPHVLVVDDNDLARAVLGSLLKKHGCTVVTADSGEAALAALHDPRALPFEYIMVDLNMPDMDGLALAHHIRSERGQSTKLVMVTGENVHASRYRHALGDFDAIVEKPVTAARIGEVLTQLEGNSLPRPPAAPTQAPAAPLSGLRILVAEDVPTNQLIMRDLLESLGATVEMADNGELAIQQLAAAGDNVDLILMDIQMPEMDGLEATRRIRAGQQRADIPIIALTAHALEEERQRATASGMNDFLTKPIEPANLIAVIQRWRPAPPSIEVPAPTAPQATIRTSIPEIPGIDTERGLQRMLNKAALYEKVLRDFHSRFTGESDRIRAALTAADTNTAARSAHSLKGTGGMIGANTLAAIAADLEQAIIATSPETPAHLERFEKELNQVLAGIKSAFDIA